MTSVPVPESTIWPQLTLIAAVSASHMSMPNHWLPYSIVARAHGWSLQHTLLLTLLGAFGHVSVIVIVVAAISGISGALLSHDTYTMLSAAVLVVFGLYYLYTYFTRRQSCCVDTPTDRDASSVIPLTGDDASKRQPPPSSSPSVSGPTKNTPPPAESAAVSRAAAISLVTLTSVSPCIGSMPVLVTILTPPVTLPTAMAAWAVLFVTAGGVMCSLVAVSFLGAGTINLVRVRRHERLILAICLLALAGLTMTVFNRHDHHDHDHANAHVTHADHSHQSPHSQLHADHAERVIKGNMHVVIGGKHQTFGANDQAEGADASHSSSVKQRPIARKALRAVDAQNVISKRKKSFQEQE